MALPRLLSVGRVTADFYTSPHPAANLDPLPAVIDAIASAKKTVLLAMFTFTNRAILEALRDANQRGVAIIAVLDGGQAASDFSQAKALAQFATVSLWNGSGLMHDKAFVVDGGRLIGLGSYNWSVAAEKRNVEVLLISRSRPGSKFAAAMTDNIETAFTAGTPLTA